MRAFEYASPTTKEQAVALLGPSPNDSAVLAGGTDLLALMKDEVIAPKRVVDLSGIEELRGIRYDRASGLRLGALATFEELLDHAELRKSYPSLWTAVEGVRSPQIRSVGTVGGDILQRPRCWYYRSGFGLLAQDGGRSMVVNGDNRYHAIFGGGPAYFVSPSSLGPALAALGATVRVYGAKGARDVPADTFFRTPRTSDEREHQIGPDQIVTEVRVPTPGGPNATYEVREKEALDWPLATASVALKMSGATVQSARVVLGHVAPVPWVSPEAAAALAGKTISEATAQAAGDAAVNSAKPLSGNAYKVQLARVAVKRAVLAAAGGGAR
ncbi:MAG: molybdopterin dehydrogenase [Acidobacteria bacterium]|nr:MAG: molybdopterin dehydrogenase [Acidobacteriota bacterium]